MARQRYGFDEAKITRFLKEGRGQGDGKSYKPWLTVRDVPSVGRSTRISSWTVGREHHLLSDLETRYFYLLDWADEISDIREQFPLPRDVTVEIAERLGIQHPRDRQSKVDIVITTDFVVSKRTSQGIITLARAIKPAAQLDDARVIEKLQLEKSYWENLGIDWGIVTDADIDVTICKNIERFHKHKKLTTNELPDVDIDHLANEIEVQIHLVNPKTSYTAFCSSIDKAQGLTPGSTLTVFSHLVATKQIRAPLELPIKSSTPIQHFQKSNVVKKVAWGHRA